MGAPQVFAWGCNEKQQLALDCPGEPRVPTPTPMTYLNKHKVLRIEVPGGISLLIQFRESSFFGPSRVKVALPYLRGSRWQ